MGKFWKRLFGSDTGPLQLDEPPAYVDVGVVNEASRRIARGDVVDGIAFGFAMAVQDVAAAHSVQIPPGLTYGEILSESFPRRMPPSMLDHLQRMYALYEPLRFGPRVPVREVATREFVGELRALYASPQLQRMYAEFRYDSRGMNFQPAGEPPAHG